MVKETKTIRISKKLYDSLVARAKYSDTMETVLQGLLNELSSLKQPSKPSNVKRRKK